MNIHIRWIVLFLLAAVVIAFSGTWAQEAAGPDAQAPPTASDSSQPDADAGKSADVFRSAPFA